MVYSGRYQVYCASIRNRLHTLVVLAVHTPLNEQVFSTDASFERGRTYNVSLNGYRMTELVDTHSSEMHS